MKREQDWTDALRNRLLDAEAAPPADGWERLHRELAAATPPASPARETPPRPRLGAWRWRTAAAAAVVVLCLGAGELLRHAAVEQQPAAPQFTRSKPSGATETAADGQTAPENSHTLARELGLEPTSAPIALAALTPRTNQEAAAALSEIAVAAAPSHDETGEAADNDTPQPCETKPDTPRRKPATTARTAPRHSAPSDTRTIARPARQTTSLALFAGGGVSARLGEGAPVARLQQSPSSWSYNNTGEFCNDRIVLARKEEYRNSDFRHRQPLSAGFSVRKEFSHGLSLESGLIYTLLRSDVRMPYSAEELSQRLHFIGVPLRMNWRFVERNGFSLYMGAGGMVEKCVSASLGDSSISEKALQWSLAAAVGAEYRFGGPVGLYFEPDLSYYLTSTTSHTARTESPLTVSLRLGLRLTF